MSLRLLLLLAVLLGSCLWAPAAPSVRIKKVLPHLLDRQGRHTLSPSLYERDAYQAHLRLNPQLQSGIRFDVQWKAPGTQTLALILELRGRKDRESTTAVLEREVRDRSLFSQWSAVSLTGEDYRNLGDLVAWRATLWDGDELVAEQKSFLW